MPIGAELLTVQMQGNQPCLWALVNPDCGPEKRAISIFGTGHRVNESTGKYLGTFQVSGGALIFHAFESKDWHSPLRGLAASAFPG